MSLRGVTRNNVMYVKMSSMNDHLYLQKNLRTNTGECQESVSPISPRVLAMALANQCGICP